MNQAIEITVSVQRFGASGIGDASPVSVDIVHPVGFVMESFDFTTSPLTGGQSYNHIIEWTPTAAHSILNTSTNDLTGGLIIRAVANFADDDKNENDDREMSVPVAVSANKMESTAAVASPRLYSLLSFLS